MMIIWDNPLAFLLFFAAVVLSFLCILRMLVWSVHLVDKWIDRKKK